MAKDKEPIITRGKAKRVDYKAWGPFSKEVEITPAKRKKPQITHVTDRMGRGTQKAHVREAVEGLENASGVSLAPCPEFSFGVDAADDAKDGVNAKGLYASFDRTAVSHQTLVGAAGELQHRDSTINADLIHMHGHGIDAYGRISARGIGSHIIADLGMAIPQE
jgi:hypothetical protein